MNNYEYMWLFFQNVLHVLCTDGLQFNVYHRVLKNFGFQSVRKFAVTFTMKKAQRIPRSSEWTKDVYITIINLFLFVPMNFY